jgi:hypothetical protein
MPYDGLACLEEVGRGSECVPNFIREGNDGVAGITGVVEFAASRAGGTGPSNREQIHADTVKPPASAVAGGEMMPAEARSEAQPMNRSLETRMKEVEEKGLPGPSTIIVYARWDEPNEDPIKAAFVGPPPTDIPNYVFTETLTVEGVDRVLPQGHGRS